jgi:hypothetical protein
MTQKSALIEALRTIKKEKPAKINVCDCGTPLIFTFFFPYKEWFCLNCGVAYEFLGRNEKEATLELLVKKKIIYEVWNVISKYLIPYGNYKLVKCKKCKKEGEYSHRQHLTEKEKLSDEIAKKILNQLKGVFNEKKIRNMKKIKNKNHYT